MHELNLIHVVSIFQLRDSRGGLLVNIVTKYFYQR